GAALTNAPFVRPSLVGGLRYRGRLEPGWSVEAYRGGDLVAFDSADAGGGFAIDLPVRYGENPVDFVAYGPFGEIREFNRTYRVLSELLSAGRFEYGLSAGQCRSALCDATANLDLRYGASPRWTVQGGVDQFWRDTLPNRLHPYASVVANPTNAWALQGELVGRGFARGALRYEPSVDVRVEGEYTGFTRDPLSLFAQQGTRSQWSLAGFLRPRSSHGFFFFGARVDRTTTALGRTTHARLEASIQGAEIRFLPYVRTEADGVAPVRAFAGLNAFMLPRPQWGGFLGQVLFRTTTEVERRDGLFAWSAFAARPVSRGVRLELGSTWQRGVAGATYTLTITSYLPAARAVTAVAAPPGGPVTGTQFIQGSVLWDRPAGRLSVAPGPSLERSGLSGHVFLDENANGRRDVGEPGLSNVRVLVGSMSARSDSAGAYRVWDLVPFEPLFVSADSLSLDSPLLVPAFARASIVPGPNRFRTLDIPVVQAGVIEGRVVREGRGIGGVTLILTDVRTGARRSLVTFSDGGFYLLGVKPGTYELAADPRVLDALAVDAQPLSFTLTPTADGVGRSDLELRLKPRF
ncbi:MAG TPA: carboxypeptidase-like regulatory domain-containing protein, partial [Gemmatimonadales bacterium]